MKRLRRHKPRLTDHFISVRLLQFLVLVALVWAESPGTVSAGDLRHFRFDQNRSSVRFMTSTTLHTVKGEAKKFTGEILLSSVNDPSTGRVTLKIEASDLDTKHKGMNKRMREDCLEVDRFQRIRFRSLEIHNGSKSYSLGQTGQGDVVGLLDLHGVRRRISIPVVFKYTEETFSVRGKVTIKMSDFQIPDPKVLFLRVKDEVEISFDIHGFVLADPA